MLNNEVARKIYIHDKDRNIESEKRDCLREIKRKKEKKEEERYISCLEYFSIKPPKAPRLIPTIHSSFSLSNPFTSLEPLIACP